VSNAPFNFVLARFSRLLLPIGGHLQQILPRPHHDSALRSQARRSREKIEHSRADDRLTQARKDRRFDAVHCRADTALRNCQADSAGAAAITLMATQLDLASQWLRAALPPAAKRARAQRSSYLQRPLFFFGRFFFPPKKLLSMLLISWPTTCSTKFVLGRSTVPPT